MGGGYSATHRGGCATCRRVNAGAADARACREGHTPSRSNSQRTNSELDFRLWITTAVLITPSWRRTGKMASLMDGLAPTTARQHPRKRFRYPPVRETCLKKLVLEAATTGFQDPARTARSPQREQLCWKGLVGGQWVYIHESRRAKKLIPAQKLFCLAFAFLA